MTYGFFSKNDTGLFQIDSEYKNMVLTASGTISVGSQLDVSSYDEPAVFIRPASSWATIRTYGDDMVTIWAETTGSGGLITGITFKISEDNASPLPSTLDYAIYENIDYGNITPSGYGLVVYNSSEDLVYYSGYEHAIWLEILSNATSTYTYYAPNITVPYVCLNNSYGAAYIDIPGEEEADFEAITWEDSSWETRMIGIDTAKEYGGSAPWIPNNTPDTFYPIVLRLG